MTRLTVDVEWRSLGTRPNRVRLAQLRLKG
jgi:hypothetical protein